MTATTTSPKPPPAPKLNCAEYGAVGCGVRHWRTYQHFDFPNKGDVEMMDSSDIAAVKRRVEEKGWTGFSIFGTHAFLKGPDGPHYFNDLLYEGPTSLATFYLLASVPKEDRVVTASPVCGGTAFNDPLTRTFYMYRAQSDAKYPFTNVNAADIPGVMWYLHNEVVTMCPRKYAVTRILRLKVTVTKTQQLRAANSGFFLGAFKAFDYGQCTVPNCASSWVREGYTVGCQPRPYGNSPGHWYSLPGPCPTQQLGKKSPECLASEPGGLCSCTSSLGQGSCSYHYEDAGEVALNELTGIDDYSAFCASGGLEYDKITDRGRGLDFWDGFNDETQIQRRMEALKAAFRTKYPNMPETLGSQECA